MPPPHPPARVREGRRARGGAVMADALLGKYRSLYAKARVVLERWSAAQTRATNLVDSVASIYERLAHLSETSRYGPLADSFPDLPARTRDAQYAALDRVLAALEDELELFDDLANLLDKIQRDGSALVRALRPPPPFAGALRRAHQPSLAECALGLEDVWRAYHDEATLKRVVCDELVVDASVEDVKTMAKLFAAQANVDKEFIRMTLDRVPVQSTSAMNEGRRGGGGRGGAGGSPRTRGVG